MSIAALHDDVSDLRAGLDGVSHGLDAVARRMRDSTPEDIGPSECATAVTGAVAALAGRLATLAEQAADGSAAVARHHGDVPSAPPTDRQPGGDV